MDITQVPGLSGWPGIVITLFAMIIYGWYTNKSVKSKVEDAKKESAEKAEDIVKQANKDAIAAMQTHINVLKERMEEAERENVRMKHELEAIYTVLKARGIYIAIDGKMVHVQDSRGTSTTIHISDIEKEEE
jgi:cellobiose-specific phosphotransferase system component IIA